MPQPTRREVVEIDGRTGEGGGQLVRIAVCLSALTCVPIHIHHVRGNRPGKRGGGLKAQHASCINWLAEATRAQVTGCFVGSSEFTFRPTTSSTHLLNRNIKIDADSAASTLLVFQAIFPFLLFASDETNSPITLEIKGGMNVSFSLSFEYLDQVLLPSLETLGIPRVEREVLNRGWTHGTRQIGNIRFKITPLSPGTGLRGDSWPLFSKPGKVQKINISILAPKDLLDTLQSSLTKELGMLFPSITTEIVKKEDSRHPARIYALLVAHTAEGFKLGRDWLYDRTVRRKTWDAVALEVSRKVVDDLDAEIRRGHCVDEFLQDQLVVYQALTDGRTYIRGSSDDIDLERLDRTDKPFGGGSLHAKTARWVTCQLLPEIRWTSYGDVCYGSGWRSEALSLEDKLGTLRLDS